MTPEVSIVIAARNEAASIEECVRRIQRTLTCISHQPGAAAAASAAPSAPPFEILLVDGGTDETEKTAARLVHSIPQLRYLRNRDDRGKGHAIRVGVAAARGKFLAQIDADLQFLPEELPLLLEPLREDEADVVLGSRFLHESKRLPGSTTPLRFLGNHIVSGYASMLFGRRLSDVEAGLKAFTRAAIDAIDFRSDNYSYEFEIAARAIGLGLRVAEVPITTLPRLRGTSNVRVVRDGITILADMTRLYLQQ